MVREKLQYNKFLKAETLAVKKFYTLGRGGLNLQY